MVTIIKEDENQFVVLRQNLDGKGFQDPNSKELGLSIAAKRLTLNRKS